MITIQPFFFYRNSQPPSDDASDITEGSIDKVLGGIGRLATKQEEAKEKEG